MEEVVITSWQQALVLFVALAMGVLEYWLGKTDKLKSGSTLELIFNVVKKVVQAIFGKKQ